VADVDARIAAINQEMQQIGEDQARLRENIKALTATAEARQLIARYVSKADEQETRLEQLTKDRQAQAAERLRLQSELDSAIRNLAIDRSINQ
jgi:ABC-type Fe3+-citrate transport system substrate-binding protein